MNLYLHKNLIITNKRKRKASLFKIFFIDALWNIIIKNRYELNIIYYILLITLFIETISTFSF